MKEFNTLKELAKSLDFDSEAEYLEYIIDSYVNGQHQQVKDLFNAMQPDDKVYFFNTFLDNRLYFLNGINADKDFISGVIQGVRNICINEMAKAKDTFSITF